MSQVQSVAALILAAGRGERMNSEIPKVLHEAAGVSLIGHVIEAVKKAGIKRIAVVVGRHSNSLRASLNGAEIITQAKQLGTGHAVSQAHPHFRNWKGRLLILTADAPCIREETLRNFLEFHRQNQSTASILTAEVANPYGYGRILRRGDQVVGIREELDANAKEREILEINSGIYAFDSQALFHQLREIKRNKKKKEYYLTDVIELLVKAGKPVRALRVSDPSEVLGVNTRQELAMVNQILNQRELERHSKAGVTILEPAQTYIAKGVRIGRDTLIHPFTWIERGVVVGSRCEIGPFAKIRSGSKIGDDTVIGSFVEIVRTKVGKKTFVKHLSYLGDAAIGNQVNVGAGTVTANFDGRKKQKTFVQDGAFLGCNTVLVAPVTVGKRAKTGAGAVVCARQRIPAGKTVIGIPAKLMKKSKRKIS